MNALTRPLHHDVRNAIRRQLTDLRRQHEAGRCWVCRQPHGARPGRNGYVVRCPGCEADGKTCGNVERHAQLVAALGRKGSGR